MFSDYHRHHLAVLGICMTTSSFPVLLLVLNIKYVGLLCNDTITCVWDKYGWTIVSELLLSFCVSGSREAQFSQKREPFFNSNYTFFYSLYMYFCMILIYYYPSTLSTSSGTSISNIAYAGDLHVHKMNTCIVYGLFL